MSINRLTDRLQLIADQIENGETMADIGTDHGFLPLYLWENGISPKAIMCDISEPSLEKAKAAAGAYQFGSELDFRAGDGLKVLEKGEVDAVVIAGMGGHLISQIIEDDMEKSRSFGKFILQPRNNAGYLRYHLVLNGFEIVRNSLVREGKFICEIICARPGKTAEIGDFSPSVALHGEDCACWDFPSELMDSHGSLALEYARIKLNTEKKIRDGIARSLDPDNGALEIAEKRVKYFEGLLKGE